MKKTKKNNKGFSLVELIVVVLILGILAVAVTPQIMKWVDKSKVATDKDAANALKSSVQTALADWQAKGNTLPATGTDYTVTINGTAPGTVSGSWAGIETSIGEVTAGDYPTAQYKKASGSLGGFKITIKGGSGKVTVECDAQSVSP